MLEKDWLNRTIQVKSTPSDCRIPNFWYTVVRRAGDFSGLKNASGSGSNVTTATGDIPSAI